MPSFGVLWRQLQRWRPCGPAREVRVKGRGRARSPDLNTADSRNCAIARAKSWRAADVYCSRAGICILVVRAEFVGLGTTAILATTAPVARETARPRAPSSGRPRRPRWPRSSTAPPTGSPRQPRPRGPSQTAPAPLGSTRSRRRRPGPVTGVWQGSQSAIRLLVAVERYIENRLNR